MSIKRIATLLNRFEAYKPFHEHEIWFLFKAAAFGEAIGWSLLGYGVLAEKYRFFGHGWAVNIGGSVHGMLFIAYVLLVIAGYSSLGWSRPKAFLALVVSVVPYGTLVFEQWAARVRHNSKNYNRGVILEDSDADTREVLA